MARTVKTWAVVGLLLGTVTYALAEDLTLTTYYPSPRGIYQDLQVRASFLFANGTEGDGKVLVSDAAGNARWTDPTDPTVPLVPSGLVAMFPGGCPDGWSRFGDLDGAVPRGASGAGGTGGSDTHSHTATHTHTHWSDPPGGQDGFTNNSGPHQHQVDISHDHDFSGTTDDVNFSPPIRGERGPDYWATDPSHTHPFQGTTQGVNGSPMRDTQPGDGRHDHTVWVDLPGWNVGPALPPDATVSAGSNWPPYVDMVFCQRL